MNNIIRNQILSSISTAEKLAGSEELLSVIGLVATSIIDSLKNNGKVIIAGNGGSAADSQHIAAEFVNRFYFDREGLPAIAITTDTSVITAIGNDYSFDRIFARQISSIGRKGDVFLALSTSGNSVNILEAIKESHKNGIMSIGFTGSAGGKMNDLCDIIIRVPSDETPRIQEMHILIAHIVCSIVEETIFHKPDTIK
ncbi:MAG TPA: D-sedoheptulose 7-phosphate isomerase [Bacteroidales bacterium]|nr:D-sedoheptulose 7-phosphate isomerase [Bacteroidales bacterium]